MGKTLDFTFSRYVVKTFSFSVSCAKKKLAGITDKCETLGVARLQQLSVSVSKNPNLPNIMSDHVPALEGSTSSEIFAKHLNTSHFARRAFIQSESDEKYEDGRVEFVRHGCITYKLIKIGAEF